MHVFLRYLTDIQFPICTVPVASKVLRPVELLYTRDSAVVKITLSSTVQFSLGMLVSNNRN